MRLVCEKCRTKFSRWIYESGDVVTNICPACYYKVVNQREMQIQKIVADTLDEYDMRTAIGVFNKLTYPEKDKKKNQKESQEKS
jgi:hypothetical protein